MSNDWTFVVVHLKRLIEKSQDTSIRTKKFDKCESQRQAHFEEEEEQQQQKIAWKHTVHWFAMDFVLLRWAMVISF